MQVGKGLINAEIISDAYGTMLVKGGKFQGGGGSKDSQRKDETLE